jgi:hypothetical protein
VGFVIKERLFDVICGGLIALWDFFEAVLFIRTGLCPVSDNFDLIVVVLCIFTVLFVY